MTDKRHKAVQDRVEGLPSEVFDCESCVREETMKIRRSSLRDEPCADDVLLKCQACYYPRGHGVPVTREVYEEELSWRDGRTLDFVDDGPEEDIEANLKALGYFEY